MLGVNVAPSQPRGTLREPADAAAGTTTTASRAAIRTQRRMRRERTAGQCRMRRGQRRAGTARPDPGTSVMVRAVVAAAAVAQVLREHLQLAVELDLPRAAVAPDVDLPAHAPGRVVLDPDHAAAADRAARRGLRPVAQAGGMR